MRRTIGFALILHGLAHAGAGMWATPDAPLWLVTLLWWIAMTGFVAAGAGLLGIAALERRWRSLSVVAALASLGLLALYWHPVLLIGAAIDAVVLLDSIPALHAIAARQLGVPLHPTHRHLARPAAFVTVIGMLYVSAIVLLRPWYMQWGVSPREVAAALPGDELVADARYRIDHGVTIRAPADSVWPWLAQIGQDRGGFYSYAWLERLVGDPVRNADRIHPEWQAIAPGDLVRAAPPDYLGGVFGRNLGWRVVDVVPGRALVLDGWGAFVITAVDDSTSRLVVRTRGEGAPSLAALPVAPLGLFVFEPAHFVMQRRMLLGIKARAEAARPAR